MNCNSNFKNKILKIYHYFFNFINPYAKIARWNQSTGWQLLLWPCWISMALEFSSKLEKEIVLGGYFPFFRDCILFLLGSIIMRGAGCTYNDLIDHKIDEKVKRTSSRPIPSKEINKFQVVIFAILQSFLGFLILIQFNTITVFLGFLSIIMIIIYPFMKRITNWPQIFLGFVFNWGSILGWTSQAKNINLSAIILYIGFIFWTIAYDTVYSYQDKEDDLLLNIGSTSRIFKNKIKTILYILYAFMFGLIFLSFFLERVSFPALIGIILGLTFIFYKIKKLDINNPKDCLSFFQENSKIGFFIFVGLLINFL